MAKQANRGFTFGRRNELARARGFSSYSQQRKFSATVRNRTDLAALPPDAREVRQQAHDVLAVARRDGIDLGEAARRQHVSLPGVVWWLGDAASKSGGSWQPSSGDRMFRAMFIYSAGRKVPVDVRGHKAASAIGRYHAALRHYVHSDPRDASKLAAFTGKTVGGMEFETDVDVLDELERRGEFDFESIYRMVD
jgi:hypothetical protein